jgi:hypothetical protein
VDTVNVGLFTVTPEAVTANAPEEAPVGTLTVIELGPQMRTEHVMPLSFTTPCDKPKLLPLIVTGAPIEADVGEIPVIVGGGTTVKETPLELTPAATTTTLPVVAVAGTTATMLVALHAVTVADVPLKVTVPEACGPPKFVPVIVTDAPGAPVVRDRPEMEGGPVTVKPALFESTPFTWTITLPVAAPVGTETTILVSPQLEAVVVAVPLNVTVLAPCVAPKFAPRIVTVEIGAPLDGESPAM